MPREVMTPELAQLIDARASELFKARLALANTNTPFGLIRVDLNLATARTSGDPFKVSFPFKSVYVQSATDQLVEIEMQPDTQDAIQGSIALKQNDSIVFDNPISKAFLTWGAQTGKSMSLIFFVSAEFRSGSQISVQGGGVSISEGTSFTTTRVDLTAATATSVVSSNSLRKVASIQNNTGADVWFGGSSVSNTGANLGLKVPAGSTLQWKNTAELYAYSVAGGTGDSGLLVFEEL